MPGRPFQPNQSGNPGGRPARGGFERKLRELAGPDGKRLAEFAFAVLAADVDKLKSEIAKDDWAAMSPEQRAAIIVSAVPKLAERIQALHFIADHGYGKAPPFVAEDSPLGNASEADLLSQVIDAMDPAIVARVVAGKKLPKTEEAH